MRYFVVDAFADKLFQGNPAGVCVADGPLSEGLMQRIASENNLSETAFLARRDDGGYDLRWFTPLEEIDLCGHATLGSSFVVFNELEPDRQSVAFHTRSGVLRVERRGELLEMAFPVRRPERVPLDPIAPLLIEALGVNPVETWLYRDLLVLVNSQRDVERLVPDVGKMRLLPMGKAVVITARGDAGGPDFVSRFFAPEMGIAEEPVTGSSHSMLVPFWADRLGKDRFVARQLSARGGTLHCALTPEAVLISGRSHLLTFLLIWRMYDEAWSLSFPGACPSYPLFRGLYNRAEPKAPQSCAHPVQAAPWRKQAPRIQKYPPPRCCRPTAFQSNRQYQKCFAF